VDLFGRFNDGPQPKTPSAVSIYVGGHLAPTLEAGDLAEAPGYLSREGTIIPLVSDPELWAEVGWDAGKHPLPSGKLIENLTQGFDYYGHKLAGRGQFRAPKEVVFSLPSELSVALMELPPSRRLEVMQDLHRTWTQERDQVAVRIMKDGDRTWEQAKTLSLGFVHLEDRAGEPSLHFHDYAFPVAKDMNGRWRAYENGKAANDMPKLRAKLTDAAIASCAKHGIKIDWPRGLAKERDGEVHGVTVTLPGGRVIEAGSLNRTRRGDVLAAQAIRETLGVPALTPKELELVRRETGKLPIEIKGVKRRDYLVKKLNGLGMLDPEGRILPVAEIEARLPKIAEGLEVAAAKLRQVPMPGSQADPVALVEQKIQDIKTAVPAITQQVEAAQVAGRIRWTQDYQRVMDQVAVAGKLRTDGLTKQDRDLLSKLKKAGLLEGEMIDGRMEYGISELGRLRLSRGEVVPATGPVLPPVLPLEAGPVQPGSLGGFGSGWGAAEAARPRVGAPGADEAGVAGVELPAVGSAGDLSGRTPEVGGPEGHRSPGLGPGAVAEPGTLLPQTAASPDIHPGREVRADGPAANLPGAGGGPQDDRQVGSLPQGDGLRSGNHLPPSVPILGEPVAALEGPAYGNAARHSLPVGAQHGPAGLPDAGGPNHSLPRSGQAGGRSGRGYRTEAHPRLGSHPRGSWDGSLGRDLHARPARMAVERNAGWARLADEPGCAGRHHFGGGQGLRQGGGRFGGVSLGLAGAARMVAPGQLQRGSRGSTGGHVEHVIHVAAHSAARAGAIAWDLMAAAAGAAMAAGQFAARKIAEHQYWLREKHRLEAAKIEAQKVEAQKIAAAKVAEIERQQRIKLEQKVEPPKQPKQDQSKYRIGSR